MMLSKISLRALEFSEDNKFNLEKFTPSSEFGFFSDCIIFRNASILFNSEYRNVFNVI